MKERVAESFSELVDSLYDGSWNSTLQRFRADASGDYEVMVRLRAPGAPWPSRLRAQRAHPHGAACRR